MKVADIKNENAVIHCHNYNECRTVELCLHNLDRTWCNGETYMQTSKATDYGGNNGYTVHTGQFSKIEFYQLHKKNYVIYDFSQFEDLKELSFDGKTIITEL